MAKNQNWWWAALLGVAAAAAYAVSRPFGALRGMVRLTSKRPALGLTWWLSVGQPDGWQDHLSRVDFVTVKVTDGTRILGDKQAGAVVAAARAAGTPVQTWSYHYARTEAAAHAEGIAAAREALRLGAKAHWVNAEHQWAGGYMDHTGAADPVASMVALVAAFRATAPGIAVIFNSTTSWMSPRLTPALDRDVASLFDAYGPMIYSSGSTGGVKTMRKKWGRGYAIAQELGIPFCPMVGSGRRDKNGKFWTNFDGLAAIQAEQPADWIAFWVAPGQADRLYTANALNPSIAEFKGMT